MQSEENNLIVLPGPFGAPIEIKPSLVMLMVVLVVISGARSLAAVLDTLIVVGMIFTAVLLHEWGHAWGAWIQRVPVHRVVLWGGGGLCFAGARSRREDELIVAMGPIVNLALWAICSLIAGNIFETQLTASRPSADMLNIASWLSYFAALNLFLFFLNMVPIFPLDGGKLFFLMLVRFIPERSAAVWAGRVGLVACGVYLFAMLWSYVYLGWVFLFIPSFALHRAMAQGRVMP